MGAKIAHSKPAAAAQAPVTVTVTRRLVREHFGGLGFQADTFPDDTTPEFFDQVLAKRWREMNPRFARITRIPEMWHTGFSDTKAREALLQQVLFLQESTGTEVYLTGGLRDVPAGPERDAWAASIVDELQYLLDAGATNIKWYCITNELSLHRWSDLCKDLPTFRAYEQAIFDELQRRKLPIKLLATDASPMFNWDTIEWAAQNMDPITGVYGGHDYFNDFPVDDPSFYGAFKSKCAWAVDLARARGKDFILGEFGTRQYFENHWGARWDVPEAFETSTEPMAALQLAEATVAAVNAGVYATSYWTFADYPDTAGGSRGVNHCGTFRWMTGDATPRARYYSYGILTRFVRGPATVHDVETGDPLIRAAAIRNEETGAWSIAVVNRATRDMPIAVELAENADKPFRRYVYDPAHVPVTVDGDLPEASGTVAATRGTLEDAIPPTSLAVYTTAYREEPPTPVRGLTAAVVPNGTALRWESGADIGYYRIYRFQDRVRIGSAAKAEFVDYGPTREQPGDYSVVAVDRSGNASPPAHVLRPTTP